MDYLRGDLSRIFFLVTIAVVCFRAVSGNGGGISLPMSTDSAQIFKDRAKRSLATICVEIKPSGPREEPYYMCRAADFPPFPKLPIGNSDGASKPTPPTYAGSDRFGTTANNKGNGNAGTNFPNFTDNNGAKSNGNKESNTPNEPQVQFHPQLSSPNGSGKSGSGTNVPSKKTNSDKAQSFPPQPTTTGYKFPEQFPPQQPSVYDQNFRPQLHHYLPQPQPMKPMSQQYQLEVPGFHLGQPFFRPSTEPKSSERSENLKGYGSTFDENSNEKFGKNSQNPSAYNSQHSNVFGTNPSPSLYKNKAPGFPSYSPVNNGYKESQRGHITAECGEDCRESTGKPAAGGGTPFGATYNGHHPGSKVVHGGYVEPKLGKPHHSNRAGSHTSKSNVPSIPIAHVTTPPYFPEAFYVAPGSAIAPHPSPLRFSMHATAEVAPDEFPELSFMGGHDVPKLSSNFMRKGSTLMNDGPRSDTNLKVPGGQVLQPQNSYSQTHDSSPHNQPSADRYRTMIDDEVLQLPNWGFSPDEFDLYRSAPPAEDVTVNIGPASIYTPSRVIPLEYLEDPVMRTFYSSLPDVGPLPVIRPPITLSYPSSQTHQVASYSQPASQRIQYQQPYGCSNPYQRNPQFYNYNPCPPSREYNVQPVFIALPCFGQTLYQSVAGGPLGMPTPSMSYDQLAMANPLADPLTRLLSIGDPVKHFLTSVQTQPAPSPPPEKPTDQRTKPVPVTTVATSVDIDSNESAESAEENQDPKLKKTNDEATSGPPEQKEATSMKPESANFSEPTTLRASLEVISAPQQVTTQSPIDSSNSEEDSGERTRTTFRSLVATARRLAGLIRTDPEADRLFSTDSSTQAPSPKKQRQASKNMNGNGGGKRKFVQQI